VRIGVRVFPGRPKSPSRPLPHCSFQRETLAITGASGAPYAVRLLEVLVRERVPVWLLVSGHGSRLLKDECVGDERREECGFRLLLRATGPDGHLHERVATAVLADALSSQSARSEQFASFQTDAPACDNCGSITVRNGNCYLCHNCGSSMGCS
jgi:hypothetical protein